MGTWRIVKTYLLQDSARRSWSLEIKALTRCVYTMILFIYIKRYICCRLVQIARKNYYKGLEQVFSFTL